MATVLLVEDDPHIRSLISAALQRGGHSVLEAENGLDALQAIKGHGDIRVVVTDFCMPGMSGIELVQTVRMSFAEVNAVLLSGYWIHPLPDDLDIEFMTKPCSMSRLVAKVNQLLAQRLYRWSSRLSERRDDHRHRCGRGWLARCFAPEAAILRPAPRLDLLQV